MGMGKCLVIGRRCVLFIEFCFQVGHVVYFGTEDEVIGEAGLVDYIFGFSAAAAFHGVGIDV